jgi:hypothetical protein
LRSFRRLPTRAALDRVEQAIDAMEAAEASRGFYRLRPAGCPDDGRAQMTADYARAHGRMFTPDLDVRFERP